MRGWCEDLRNAFPARPEDIRDGKSRGTDLINDLCVIVFDTYLCNLLDTIFLFCVYID